MYILVVKWSAYETSTYEFANLRELKGYVEKNTYLIREKYYIAKVLATEHCAIDDVKDEEQW